MAITNTRLTAGTFANIAYAPSAQTRVVTTMYLCNTANTAALVNVYLVPSNANPADPNGSLIYSNVPLAGNDTYVIDGERIVLENGDGIFANITSGNAGAVVMTVSSVGA